MTNKTLVLRAKPLSPHAAGLSLLFCVSLLTAGTSGCNKRSATKPTAPPPPTATSQRSAPPALKLVTLADLPGTKQLWTSKGGSPVDLRWPLPNELRFRLSDPAGAFSGFEIVKYERLAVDTGITTVTDSQEAKAVASANGKLEITVDAHYAFGWDAQGKQVDLSTFALEYRLTGSTNWTNISTSISGEPKGVGISADGSLIVFVIADVATVIDLNGRTVDTIQAADDALWGVDANSVYCLHRDNTSVLRQPETDIFGLRSRGLQAQMPDLTRHTSTEVFRYNLQSKQRQDLFSCDGLKCIAASPDGGYLAYICEVADVDAAKEKRALTNASSTQPAFLQAILSQAAAHLPTNHEMRLYQVSTGRTFRASMKCSGSPTLAFAPDGKSLAYTNNDRVVRVSPDEIIAAATK